ncbi:hypothetical protein PROFUN_00350 [Planoprotostelium fungivorum]|uniref:Pentatricopeptide repeat-containing protein n=1 Tax=Planoprotostelium fungivorum TaxID=1890364 RepID=A0A2P6NY76_9EUKA|nr:hypothetical protein PROFUN_00350 [Planoprotostelium fungivorum]
MMMIARLSFAPQRGLSVSPFIFRRGVTTSASPIKIKNVRDPPKKRGSIEEREESRSPLFMIDGLDKLVAKVKEEGPKATKSPRTKSPRSHSDHNDKPASLAKDHRSPSQKTSPSQKKTSPPSYKSSPPPYKSSPPSKTTQAPKTSFNIDRLLRPITVPTPSADLNRKNNSFVSPKLHDTDYTKDDVPLFGDDVPDDYAGKVPNRRERERGGRGKSKGGRIGGGITQKRQITADSVNAWLMGLYREGKFQQVVKALDGLTLFKQKSLTHDTIRAVIKSLAIQKKAPNVFGEVVLPMIRPWEPAKVAEVMRSAGINISADCEEDAVFQKIYDVMEQGKVSEARTTLWLADILGHMDIQWNIDVRRKVFRAYVTLEMKDQARDMFMSLNEITTSDYNQYMVLLSIMGETTKTEDVLGRMSSADKETVTTLCARYAAALQLDAALEVLKLGIKCEQVPPPIAFQTILRACALSQDYEVATKVMDLFRQLHPMDELTMILAISAYTACGKNTEAQKISRERKVWIMNRGQVEDTERSLAKLYERCAGTEPSDLNPVDIVNTAMHIIFNQHPKYIDLSDDPNHKKEGLKTIGMQLPGIDHMHPRALPYLDHGLQIIAIGRGVTRAEAQSQCCRSVGGKVVKRWDTFFDPVEETEPL